MRVVRRAKRMARQEALSTPGGPDLAVMVNVNHVLSADVGLNGGLTGSAPFTGGHAPYTGGHAPFTGGHTPYTGGARRRQLRRDRLRRPPAGRVGRDPSRPATRTCRTVRSS